MGKNFFQQLLARPFCIVRHGVVAHIQCDQRIDRSVDRIAAAIAIEILDKTADRFSAAICKRRIIAVSVDIQIAGVNAERGQHHNDASIIRHDIRAKLLDMPVKIKTIWKLVSRCDLLRTGCEAKVHQNPVVRQQRAIPTGLIVRKDILFNLFQNVAIWDGIWSFGVLDRDLVRLF